MLASWLWAAETAWTAWPNLTMFWWLLVAVPLLLVAVVRRDARSVLLLLLPVAVLVWSYGSALLPPRAPAVAPALRVVSFNTYVGLSGHDHVVALAEHTDADVLLLQEVFPDREEALRTALAELLPFAHVDGNPRIGGVAVFSRHPIVDVAPIPVASERSRASSVVTLDVGGELVQVVSVHLISPCPTCGPSLLGRLRLEGEVRQAEADAVLEALDPELPAIVGGDLNSNERSAAYRTLVAAGFDDPQRRAGWGMGFTVPAGGRLPPVLRMDWVLTRNLVPVRASVEQDWESDHRPVVVDVAFP